MPLLDEDLAVGCVQLESSESGNYSRSYMIIDFSTQKLRLYPEEAEFASDLSQYTVQIKINCQYITKVNAYGNRPKVLNCLEIVTTSGSHVISVDSEEERDEWVDSIRKASMRQSCSAKCIASVAQSSKDITMSPSGYEIKVVGGAVQKVPITVNNGNNGEKTGERTDGMAVRQEEDGTKVRRKGFPRIIKAGHGIKQGAVMKNWKRRFFVLTELSFGYYKSIEEHEPIKAVSVGEIISVAASKEIPGKEYLFEVVTPNRTFYVQADSEPDMEDWIRVCQSLIQTVKPTLQHHGPAVKRSCSGDRITMV